MNQLSTIKKCFGNMYCRIQNDRCIGKDTAKNELTLDLLYIAYWVSCRDNDCDISCFVRKYCAACDAPNVLPMAASDPGCCVTAYASGEGNITFEKVAGEWVAGFSLPTGTVTDATFTSYSYSVAFWQGGVQIDEVEVDGATAAAELSTPFRGDGVYLLAARYQYNGGAAGFAITKLVEVKGNMISKYVQIDSIVMGDIDCRTINASGTYTASSGTNVINEFWVESIPDVDETPFSGFGPTLTNYVLPELGVIVIVYVAMLDAAAWPDYDFSIQGVFGFMLIEQNCAPTPTLSLGVSYSCVDSKGASTISYTNIPDGTTIHLEYSADSGATWLTFDDDILTDGSGSQTNNNALVMADGDYLCRAISDDETIVSNSYALHIDCVDPPVPVVKDFMLSQLSGDQTYVSGFPIPYSMHFTLATQSARAVAPAWATRWIVYDLVNDVLISDTTDAMFLDTVTKTIVFPHEGEFVVSAHTNNDAMLESVSFAVVVVQDLAGAGDINGRIAHAAFIGVQKGTDARPVSIGIEPYYGFLSNIPSSPPGMTFEIYENSGLSIDTHGVVQHTNPPYVVLGSGGSFICDKDYNGTQNFQNRTTVSLEAQFPNYFARQGMSQLIGHGMISL